MGWRKSRLALSLLAWPIEKIEELTATPDRPIWQKAILPATQQELGWTWVSISIIPGVITLVLGLIIQFEFFAPGFQIFAGVAGFDKIRSQFSTIIILFFLMPLVVGGILNVLLPSITGSDALKAKRLATAALWLFLAMTVVYIMASVWDFAPKNDGWTIYPPLSIPGGTLELAGSSGAMSVTLYALSMVGVYCAIFLCTIHSAITIGVHAKRSSPTIAMVGVALLLVANVILLLHAPIFENTEFFKNQLLGNPTTASVLGPITIGYVTRNFENMGLISLIFPAALSYFLLIISNLNFQAKIQTLKLVALGLGYSIVLYLGWIFPIGVFLLGIIFLIGIQFWIIQNQTLSISWIWLASLPVVFASFFYGMNNFSTAGESLFFNPSENFVTYHYMVFCLIGIVIFSFFWWAIYQKSCRPFILLMGSLQFWVTFIGVLYTLYIQLFHFNQNLPRRSPEYTLFVEFSSINSSIGVFAAAVGLPFLIAAALYAKNYGGSDENSEADFFT